RQGTLSNSPARRRIWATTAGTCRPPACRPRWRANRAYRRGWWWPRTTSRWCRHRSAWRARHRGFAVHSSGNCHAPCWRLVAWPWTAAWRLLLPCALRFGLLRKIVIEFLERTGPAALVIIARLVVEELRVLERQQGAVIAIPCQRDADQRFPLRRRMPRPAEHQPVIGHHFAEAAADLVALTARAFKADAVAATDAQVHFGNDRVLARVPRAKPAHYFFRVRPGAEDLARRRSEASLEREAWLVGHGSSSRKFSSPSSFSFHQTPYPFTPSNPPPHLFPPS